MFRPWGWWLRKTFHGMLLDGRGGDGDPLQWNYCSEIIIEQNYSCLIYGWHPEEAFKIVFNRLRDAPWKYTTVGSYTAVRYPTDVSMGERRINGHTLTSAKENSGSETRTPDSHKTTWFVSHFLQNVPLACRSHDFPVFTSAFFSARKHLSSVYFVLV